MNHDSKIKVWTELLIWRILTLLKFQISSQLLWHFVKNQDIIWTQNMGKQLAWRIFVYWSKIYFQNLGSIGFHSLSGLHLDSYFDNNILYMALANHWSNLSCSLLNYCLPRPAIMDRVPVCSVHSRVATVCIATHLPAKHSCSLWTRYLSMLPKPPHYCLWVLLNSCPLCSRTIIWSYSSNNR